MESRGAESFICIDRAELARNNASRLASIDSASSVRTLDCYYRILHHRDHVLLRMLCKRIIRFDGFVNAFLKAFQVKRPNIVKQAAGFSCLYKSTTVYHFLPCPHLLFSSLHSLTAGGTVDAYGISKFECPLPL